MLDTMPEPCVLLALWPRSTNWRCLEKLPRANSCVLKNWGCSVSKAADEKKITARPVDPKPDCSTKCTRAVAAGVNLHECIVTLLPLPILASSCRLGASCVCVHWRCFDVVAEVAQLLRFPFGCALVSCRLRIRRQFVLRSLFHSVKLLV